jgi:hypothetical protein
MLLLLLACAPVGADAFGNCTVTTVAEDAGNDDGSSYVEVSEYDAQARIVAERLGAERRLPIGLLLRHAGRHPHPARRRHADRRVAGVSSGWEGVDRVRPGVRRRGHTARPGVLGAHLRLPWAPRHLRARRRRRRRAGPHQHQHLGGRHGPGPHRAGDPHRLRVPGVGFEVRVRLLVSGGGAAQCHRVRLEVGAVPPSETRGRCSALERDFSALQCH